LIIDDIADTGATLDFLNKKYSGISSACLINKGDPKCDFWAEQVDSDIWIQFPWEKN
jgi:hypoxanthine phosphoribosyltransferase